jgi:cysteine desulfuration protein SufE
MSLATLERTVNDLGARSSGEQITALIALSARLPDLAPRASELWSVQDVRRDIECDDTVGLYARLDGDRVHLAAEIGQEVTTLTKALTALLVEHLDGETPHNIRRVTANDLAPIVPESLLRQRRNTVHYAVQRLQDVVRALEVSSPATPVGV